MTRTDCAFFLPLSIAQSKKSDGKQVSQDPAGSSLSADPATMVYFSPYGRGCN